MTISLDTKISRHEDIFAGEVDEDLVMVSINSGNYHVLNLTGRSIWEMMETPSSIREICSRLVEAYDIDAETCRKEVMAFVEKLKTKKIIKITEQGS